MTNAPIPFSAGFVRAALDANLAAPAGAINPDGSPATKRFSVYRNNIAVGLTDALAQSFPVVQKLVGDEFFTAMAGIFLRAHPPKSQIMARYGDGFPQFLTDFGPAQHLGYLPDVARLEILMRQSYHAADSHAIAPETLARLGDELGKVRIHLAPSLRAMSSPWPVQSIWAANMADGPKPVPGGQDVAVLRRDFDPRPVVLPPGGAEVARGLLAGHPLSTLLYEDGPNAANVPQDFDLGQFLGALIAHNAIIGIQTIPK